VTGAGTLGARLDQVRSRGCALVDQELEEGLRSAAAPIRSREGVVVAAVNLSVSAGRSMRRFVPPLVETAVQTSRDLVPA